MPGKSRDPVYRGAVNRGFTICSKHPNALILLFEYTALVTAADYWVFQQFLLDHGIVHRQLVPNYTWNESHESSS